MSPSQPGREWLIPLLGVEPGGPGPLTRRQKDGSAAVVVVVGPKSPSEVWPGEQAPPATDNGMFVLNSHPVWLKGPKHPQKPAAQTSRKTSEDRL